MLSELVHTDSYKNVHAGNESIEGRMTACNGKIGQWTTTQQPTSERWSGGGGSGGGSGSGSAAEAHSATAALR
jgi:hypothetical protein